MNLLNKISEKKELESVYSSNTAEFVAVYGRSRIEKTILIRSFFKRKKNLIFLNTTGTLQGSMREQIENFTQQIGDAFYQGVQLKSGKN